MNVVKFQPTSRNSSPWLYRPSWTLGLSRYRLIKYSVIIGAFAVLFVASILNGSIDATPPISIGVASITVVDGDTVRANGQTYRLVGFDTPESGSLARCERERKLADSATTRLRQLVANGQPALERVPCSCPPGTEGTQQCNHGRLCARLRAEGRDVGTILINEGIARPYVCGQTGCPRRQSWCG
jgi:endonuclease YncB( thermonuclease family)